MGRALCFAGPGSGIRKLFLVRIFFIYSYGEYFVFICDGNILRLSSTGIRAVNLIVNTPAQLGEILSSARQAKGMTQAEAAARTGISQPRLSSLETTRTESLSLGQLLALTSLYDLELSVRTKGESGVSDTEW